MKKLMPLLALCGASCLPPSQEGRSYIPPSSFGERDSALGQKMLNRLENILKSKCEKSYVNQNGFGCINYSLRHPDSDMWLWRCNYEYRWKEVGKITMKIPFRSPEKWWIYVTETKELDDTIQTIEPLFGPFFTAEAQEIADLLTSLKDFYSSP